MTRLRRAPAFVYLALAAGLLASCAGDDRGGLGLEVVDATSGSPTPARVEIRDGQGRTYVARDALELIDDCRQPPLHNWVPWSAPLQFAVAGKRELSNPFTGTTQFYVDGAATAELPPGRYVVTAAKGIEYRLAVAEVAISAGTTTSVRLELQRWIDLPAAGWYGADDHLHIPRPGAAFDANLLRWMQAEDLHVGNFLQMGLARDVHITPQRDFGAPSVVRDGDTLLVGGQENPRTHLLGHSIVLGAPRWIDYPGNYLLYERFWEEAHRLGAANGYAHLALGGAEEGLAVWAHRELLDFIEVLNFGLPYYERWYEVLNLGIRMAPTAGTDYPCLPGLPGRERFYTRLDGALGLEAWLRGVRAGRTFVTNGPIPQLEVAGAGPGEELTFRDRAGVRVRAAVRFDPQRDDVQRLELIRAGEVIDSVRATASSAGSGLLALETMVELSASTWLAVRASGTKRGETTIRSLDPLISAVDDPPRATTEELRRDMARWGDRDITRPSAAHTAPVWVTVAGTPAIGEQPRADEVRRAWLARLDALEGRLDEERLAALAGFPGRGDGVPLEELRAARRELLRAIEFAREHWTAGASGTR